METQKFNSFKSHKLNSGQSLLEATIAISALLIILSATATAVITSINNSVFVRNQNTANKLAQEGMEFIRKIKTDDYIYFVTLTPNPFGSTKQYCLGTLSSPLTEDVIPVADIDCPDINISNTDFDRRAIVTKLNPGTASNDCSFQCPGPGPGCASRLNNVTTHSVVIDVSWSSGKCAAGVKCHKSQLESCFINNL